MTVAYELPHGIPEEVAMSGERLNKVRDVVQEFIDEGRIQGAVEGVSRRGKVIYFDAQGVANVKTQTPLQEDALFNMASSTKPILGVAAMMMIEEGLFKPSDPVEEYVPEFKDIKVAVFKEASEKAQYKKSWELVDALQSFCLCDPRQGSGLSYSIDLNILLYATDASSPHQSSAHEFLRDRSADPEVLCLTWPTLMGYLRIATHPRIFSSPLSHEDALSNVEALLNLPQSRVIVENERFTGIYREVTHGLAVRGNLVPDAHVAALLRLHDVKTIYTNDSDFRKFAFLNVQNPLG